MNCTLLSILFLEATMNCTLISILFLEATMNCTLISIIFLEATMNCSLISILFLEATMNCTLMLQSPFNDVTFEIVSQTSAVVQEMFLILANGEIKTRKSLVNSSGDPYEVS